MRLKRQVSDSEENTYENHVDSYFEIIFSRTES